MKPVKRRGRWAFVIGFGVGHVLGAKAGRQRYEDLRELWQRVSSSSFATKFRAKSAQAERGFAENAYAPDGYEAELANLRGPGVEP